MSGNRQANLQVKGSSMPAVVVTIVFVVLKLAHVIAWSWLWVLSPLWISFGLALIFFAFVAVVFTAASKLPNQRSRRAYRRR